MDAAVTLKATISEIDLVREALTHYADDLKESAKNHDNGIIQRDKDRKREAEIRFLLEKLK